MPCVTKHLGETKRTQGKKLISLLGQKDGSVETAWLTCCRFLPRQKSTAGPTSSPLRSLAAQGVQVQPSAVSLHAKNPTVSPIVRFFF